MPASCEVTSPPTAIKHKVQRAVSQAKRRSQKLLCEPDISSKSKTAVPETGHSGRYPQTLFGFQRHIRSYVSAFDLDFLRHGRVGRSGFAMIKLERVLAVFHVLDGVFAILVGNGKVGMIHHARIGKHPGMDVALKTEKHFSAWITEGQV